MISFVRKVVFYDASVITFSFFCAKCLQQRLWGNLIPYHAQNILKNISTLREQLGCKIHQQKNDFDTLNRKKCCKKCYKKFTYEFYTTSNVTNLWLLETYKF